MITNSDKKSRHPLTGLQIMRVKRLPEWHRLDRAYGHALIALVPLIALYWIFPADSSVQEAQANINVIGPLYFITVLLLLANKVAKISSYFVWTGALWFPVQSAVFFGFGPLVQVFGNETTMRWLSASPLSVDTTDLFRANTLSVTAITLALFGFWLYFKMRRGPSQDQKPSRFASIPLFQLGLAMILVCGSLKYLVINPSQWSENPTIIPGWLGNIAGLTDVGFGILAYLASRGNRGARKIFLVFWPIQLFLCTLSFSKTEIVWAMVVPLMSNFVARSNRLRLAGGLIVIAFIFYLAQPYVHYARAVTLDRTGSINQAGYVERAEILITYLSEGDEDRAIQSEPWIDRQGWWTRLDYTGVQAEVMRLHDSGFANPSLSQAWMFFIPRAIWPDKPNLSLAAVDFYRLVTGHHEANSFLGISYYGDLYWQYGWIGIFIGSPLIGLLFASMSARSFWWVKHREYVMMPAIIIALELSIIGPTDTILTSLVGGSVMYFWFVLLLRLLENVLPTVRIGSSTRSV